MKTKPSFRSQDGATLIEVLVAILVLSIALLGIAGLTSASLRFSQGSWARAAVSSALSDLADRVRSNPGAAVTAYQATGANYAAQQASGFALPFATDCMAATCANPDDLAAFQLEQWRLEVRRNLPSAAVWVSGARNTGYLATVMWFDKSFLKSDGKTLDSTPSCPAAMPAGLPARACCPAGAAAPDGVRCTNMTLLP